MATPKILWIVLICLFLVILVGFIVALVRRLQISYQPTEPIKVWTFWHGKESPTIALCLDSIKRACDQSKHPFDHIHLNIEKAKAMIPGIQNNPCFCEYSPNAIALTSDIIRFHFLKKYGGFWLDASILFLKPLDQVFDMSQPDVFQGFYNPDNCPRGTSNTFPVIETSMLYSPPYHPLMQAWLSNLNLRNCCDNSVRASHSKSLPFSRHLKQLNPSYHFVYYAIYNHLRSIGGIQEIPNVQLYSTRKWRYFAYKTINIRDFVTLSKNQFIKKYDYKNQKLVKLISRDYRLLDRLVDEARDDCLLKTRKF